ncbi:MAG: GNAT family N-acetyltransferase [Candidatus Bipolaricaulota bacterium]|nr:GNAT family N-acetyltransferase [Candidatus Bipolaricaulota bacterium]
MGDLVRVERRSAARAVQSLAAAFQDYPLLTYARPDPEGRARLARAFCAVAVRYALRWGEVHATAGFEGVAAWLPGEHFPLTAGKALRAVPLGTFLALGRYGGRRLRSAGAHLDLLHRRLAPPGHEFLFILGVRPEAQGQGHGGRLLRPVLSRLDREGRPCYVDTVNPGAVPFYARFGFRVLEESAIPGTPLTGWALLRPPGG